MNRFPPRRRLLALAVASALLGLQSPLQAGVILDGSYGSDPNLPGPINQPTLLLPGTRIWLHGGASFAAISGGVAQLSQLSVGNGLGLSTATLDGVGSRLSLHSDGNGNRFEVGNSGAGFAAVVNGGLLDGRADAHLCQLGGRWCNNFIGNAAGSEGHLVVHGSGSEARFLHGFVVANINVSGSFGVAGATTTGRVEVQAGGTLRSDELLAGVSWLGPNGNGNERSRAFITVEGSGSLWEVNGIAMNGGHAQVVMAEGVRSTTAAVISNGALMRLAPSGTDTNFLVAQNGGTANLLLDAGRLELLGGAGQQFVGVGRGADSQGDMALHNGGAVQVNGQRADVQVGQDGGRGTLLLDASTLRLDATQSSGFGLGIEGGQGLLRLMNGSQWLQAGSDSAYAVVGRASGGQGRLEILSGSVFDAQRLHIGAGNGGVGDVLLDGAGSRLVLRQRDGDRLQVGEWGTGSLMVSGGALLDATQDQAACAGRWCGALIGHAAGSTARFTITGAGSEARFLDTLNIATTQVATQGVEGWSHGTPGGTTNARIEVLDGGGLSASSVHSGITDSLSANGQERSFMSGLVQGAGSRWLLHGEIGDGRGASLGLAHGARSFADLQVLDGGVLRLQAPAGLNATVDLGWRGGEAKLRVSGSQVQLVGEHTRFVMGGDGGKGEAVFEQGALLDLQGSSHSYLNLGEQGGTARLQVLSGATLQGMRDLNVGTHDGRSRGELLVAGAGSRVQTQQNAGSSSGMVLVNHGLMDLREGASVQAFALSVGAAKPGAGTGELLLAGADTRLSLQGVDWHRVGLERGSVVVSGGAWLDAADNAAACAGRWCGTFLANNAGSDATLRVTGSGSRASFLSNFIAGGSFVSTQAVEGYVIGQAGALSRVAIEVNGGGLLETETVSLGYGPQGSGKSGSERAQVDVLLDGAGSQWIVRGQGTGGAVFNTGLAGGLGSQVNIAVRNGALLEMQGSTTAGSTMTLAREGGQTLMDVRGVGSTLRFTGEAGLSSFRVGRLNGNASLSFSEGARLEGLDLLFLGGSGGSGSLTASGAATRLNLEGTIAQLSVGSSGHGRAVLSDGAQMRLTGSDASYLTMVANANSSGQLHLSGSGTRLDLHSGSAGAGTNPVAHVGQFGLGQVRVAGGAVLGLQGGRTATPDAQAYTTLAVGKDAGMGSLWIEGAGSRVDVLGGDARVMVGEGGGSGQLQLRAGGVLASTYLGVGLGGQGQLTMNAAELHLQGHWDSQDLGARLAIGAGSGSGNVSLQAGSRVWLDNGGSGDGAALVLGGISSSAGGHALLNVSGGSRIDIVSQAGAAKALIGQSGSALADFSGASHLDVGDGRLWIAKETGSTGTLRLREGSTAVAGWVGVGVNAPGTDTGQGWLNVTSGAQLTAGTLEIGSHGLLSGSGTINANVINRGVFNPGDSPGTLTINGSFSVATGGRLLLEVQSDGQGGFLTDRLLLNGGAVDLGGLAIEFRFLAGTDPTAFQASGGFDIDQFVQADGAALPDDAFGTVSFAASSSDYTFTSFSYTAGGGAVFEAVPVPEPGTWLMMTLGLAGLLMGRRRVKE
ncbi:MAG: PEP-CTERM sorting domain-containing protein [Burkholderiales bacterium]|nr:PEP-CTERM sorting domain-containing protein [Burkholderiales bacterium]